ncbi:MAG TPA: ribonuclease D [Porticoccaceae bacterium]|nr:ribonuclease D [Porticoccaceae bacterium]
MCEKSVEAHGLVSDPRSLAQALESLRGAEAVALDTEFIRTDTYYPCLALIQISDGQTTWLIDPLAFDRDELEPLISLLKDRQVVKVLHSCSEDLEVLRHALGVLPEPFFDTQVAAAFVGLGFSLSYQALVREVEGVQLDKHETRSDWLQRPLSPEQLRYAAEDVEHLLAIHQTLRDKLISLERFSWFEQDMDIMLKAAGEEARPEDYYQRVKGAWKLNRQSLAVLRRLCNWREQEARTRDRPRNRIVADKDTLQLAMGQPRSWQQLSALGASSGRDKAGLHPRVLRVYGDQLLALIEQARADAPESYPQVLPKPVPREQGGLMKQCKRLVQQKADSLDMAVEILVRKADLSFLLQSAVEGRANLSERIETTWRKGLVGDQLLALVGEGLAANSNAVQAEEGAK